MKKLILILSIFILAFSSFAGATTVTINSLQEYDPGPTYTTQTKPVTVNSTGGSAKLVMNNGQVKHYYKGTSASGITAIFEDSGAIIDGTLDMDSGSEIYLDNLGQGSEKQLIGLKSDELVIDQFDGNIEVITDQKTTNARDYGIYTKSNIYATDGIAGTLTLDNWDGSQRACRELGESETYTSSETRAYGIWANSGDINISGGMDSDIYVEGKRSYISGMVASGGDINIDNIGGKVEVYSLDGNNNYAVWANNDVVIGDIGSSGLISAESDYSHLPCAIFSGGRIKIDNVEGIVKARSGSANGITVYASGGDVIIGSLSGNIQSLYTPPSTCEYGGNTTGVNDLGNYLNYAVYGGNINGGDLNTPMHITSTGLVEAKAGWIGAVGLRAKNKLNLVNDGTIRTDSEIDYSGYSGGYSFGRSSVGMIANEGIELVNSGKIESTDGFNSSGRGYAVYAGSGTIEGYNLAAGTADDNVDLLDGTDITGSIDLTGGANTLDMNGSGQVLGDVLATGGTIPVTADLYPGDSWLVDGQMALSDSSAVDIELSSASLSKDYYLSVKNLTMGTVTFNFALASGYTPAAGSVFDIVDWNTVSVPDANNVVLNLPSGVDWNTSSFLATGEISVNGTTECPEMTFAPGSVDATLNYEEGNYSLDVEWAVGTNDCGNDAEIYIFAVDDADQIVGS
ncbi:hypothetical protein GF336_01515, partial [Candidatus Woesearchaeota archaeon]|nr:hypothetical protein [Candidatus Woesearchaeota archaeon]